METENNELVLQILSESEEETYRLGADIATVAFPGLTLLLEGTLGSGKTTLVRGIAQALGARNVRSPSFTLINEYDGNIPIVHVDLYRLPKDGGDALGLEEYLLQDSLILVEWPDRWSSPPLADLWLVHFSLSSGGEETTRDVREIVIESRGARATVALKNLAERRRFVERS